MVELFSCCLTHSKMRSAERKVNLSFFQCLIASIAVNLYCTKFSDLSFIVDHTVLVLKIVCQFYLT